MAGDFNSILNHLSILLLTIAPASHCYARSSIARITYSKQHQSGVDHLKISPKLRVLKRKELETAKLCKIQLNWQIYLKGNSQLWLSSLDELERLFKFF